MPYWLWYRYAGWFPLAEAHRPAFVAGTATLLGILLCRRAFGSWQQAGFPIIVIINCLLYIYFESLPALILSVLIVSLVLIERRVPYDKMVVMGNAFGVVIALAVGYSVMSLNSGSRLVPAQGPAVEPAALRVK
ncbi:hypothetical protein, partial [Aquamicrobium sp.]|uniref:hypothetical protein n=1 Tax=Aquamicrobium sp. TaxID=1872579 RepID=UPI00258934B8